MSESPTPAEARAALDAADRSSAAVRGRTIAVRVAMLCFAFASLAGLLILGLVPAPGGIIGGTAFIVGAAIALGSVGATAKARPEGFRRRYLTAIGVWAAIYLVAILVGMIVLPGVAAFWIPAAVVSALPGLWFGLTQARR